MLVFEQMSKELDESGRWKVFFEEMDFIVMQNLFFEVLRNVALNILRDVDIDFWIFDDLGLNLFNLLQLDVNVFTFLSNFLFDLQFE